ncbi:YceI family protein [Prauserella oleivorans]|uniref:YceI family protein n=1 Tax=Prauserella oleivorans TaxID=1478153 RepID=A0ABW5WET3_9PSEU
MSDAVPEAESLDVPAPGTYTLDPERTRIRFTTLHMFGLGRVRGTFALRNGRVEVTEPVERSTSTATISAADIDTGNSMRDRTVRSAQYLDTDRHPDITYASTGVEVTDGEAVLRGTLTVCGREVPVDVRVYRARADDVEVRFSATTEVDRYDFGITAMKGMTGRHLTFDLDVVATRA